MANGRSGKGRGKGAGDKSSGGKILGGKTSGGNAAGGKAPPGGKAAATRAARGDGQRALAQRVKTAKGRRLSSTRWIERQLNDPYVHKARAAGYRSRAAFKLIEIDERFGVLKRGQTVVDLGAAPGGWTQVAVAKTGANDRAPVVAIDILEMDPVPGAVILTQDFADDAAPEALLAALGGRRPDVVLSDLAPETTGHRSTDHLRIVALVELALDFACSTLAQGGTFLAKVFQGGADGALLAQLRRDFRTVKHVKPPASRPESPETYVLASGFRGRSDAQADAG